MTEAPRPRRPLFRWAAAGVAALFLASSAYQASWGATQDIYEEPGPGGDGDDDGMDAADTALIATGAALGVGVIYTLFFAGDDDDDDDEEGDEARKPALKDGAAASELRLVPQQNAVSAGERAVFELQARSTTDGKWYSVTGNEAASIEVRGGSGLVRQDGAKNSFVLPITASQKGQAVVVGRLNRPGAAPLVAQTSVQVGG